MKLRPFCIVPNPPTHEINMSKQSQRYWLTFQPERAKRPLIWELSKKFDLVFDIRSASVTHKVGIIALELTGDRKVLAAAVKWLRKNRVEVDPIELDVVEG
jgi:ABC-type methionine transport system ATPase subunit